jgi:AraC family transcriptional regulator of arabinose operon
MSDLARPLRINSIGIHQCGPSWSLTPERTRKWADWDLWFLVEGHGSVDTPEGTLVLSPGSCLILRGGREYHFHQNPSGRFKHYWVHFDYLNKRGHPLTLDEMEVPALVRRLKKIEFLVSLLDRALAAFHGHPSDPNRAAKWFFAALDEVAACDHAAPESPRDLRVEQGQWIERLCQRIREQPDRTYSVAKLAEEAGYSRSYFSSLFKSVAGLSPQDYVVQARMRTAEHLLLDSNYSITAITEMLGYRDIYFFSRQFKGYHGLSPLRYRHQAILGTGRSSRRI